MVLKQECGGAVDIESLRCADAWVEVAGLSTQDIVNQIRQDGIDILVDLGGHTESSRLDVMAMVRERRQLICSSAHLDRVLAWPSCPIGEFTTPILDSAQRPYWQRGWGTQTRLGLTASTTASQTQFAIRPTPPRSLYALKVHIAPNLNVLSHCSHLRCRFTRKSSFVCPHFSTACRSRTYSTFRWAIIRPSRREGT